MAASPCLVLRLIGNALPFKMVRISSPVTITHVKGPERTRAQGARTGVPKPGFEALGPSRVRPSPAGLGRTLCTGKFEVDIGYASVRGLTGSSTSVVEFTLDLRARRKKKVEVSKNVTVVATLRKGVVEAVEAAIDAVVGQPSSVVARSGVGSWWATRFPVVRSLLTTVATALIVLARRSTQRKGPMLPSTYGDRPSSRHSPSRILALWLAAAQTAVRWTNAPSSLVSLTFLSKSSKNQPTTLTADCCGENVAGGSWAESSS